MPARWWKLVIAVQVVILCVLVVMLVVRRVNRPGPGPVVPLDASYDRRTTVRPSLIPGAGDGLFAVEPIASGAVVGELGGRLIADGTAAPDNHYLVTLHDCALDRTQPYTLLDSRDLGGPVKRINFAPRTINGTETHLQNAAIEARCDPPYVVFIALRDLQPGDEILASYGSEYDYERFIYIPEVRAYFCARTSIDCSVAYAFEP